MPYRHEVVRCTAFGECFGGAEEWSTGFYVGQAAADAADPTQASADYFLTAWQTFFTHANTSISGHYNTKGVRVAKLDVDTGKVDPALNFYAYPTVPFTGAGGGTAQPPQISVVLSMQARPDAGLGAKGRMFLPGVNEQILGNGQLHPTDTAQIVTQAAVMFNDLNDHLDIPGRLINASQGRPPYLFGDMPVNRYVQDLLVGSAYDTQRRRRNQLSETYSTAEVFLD